MKPIYFYESDYYALSNFSAHMVKFSDRLYPTAEHAFQCAKFPPGTPLFDEIWHATSPLQAKNLAGRYKSQRRPDWADVKVGIMEQILRAKALQHDEVRADLARSGTAPLVEDSPDDAFWGRGADYQGRNELGKLWMKLRAEF